MTKEALLKRKAELAAEFEKTRDLLGALSGALQDCDYWLAKLTAEEPKDVQPE